MDRRNIPIGGLLLIVAGILVALRAFGIIDFGFWFWIGLVIAGSSRPKVKQIRCCASGPVSLDLVAARYDIVSVDGKELVLRER